MSRGPGRWQRLLLDALRENEAVAVGGYVWQELGRPATRAEEVAARRAAKRLVETGQARAIYQRLLTVDRSHVTHQLVLTRLDSELMSTLIPLSAPEWIADARRNDSWGMTPSGRM